jgi:hypothetical protein
MKDKPLDHKTTGYQNKFDDGQTVRIKDTGEEVTVKRWSYAPKMVRSKRWRRCRK